MTENAENSNRKPKIELIRNVFLAFLIMTYIVLFLIWVISPKSEYAITTDQQLNLFFYSFVSLCILSISITLLVAWIGLKGLSKDKIVHKWPRTHAGLLLTITSINMVPILTAIISYILLGRKILSIPLFNGLVIISFGYLSPSTKIIRSAKLAEDTIKES